MFRVPDSSDSLPSTPSHEKQSFINAPKSTTPAHDPPSYLTNVSTTPLGPPPRSVYGSSFNAGNSTFPRGRGSPLKSYTLPHSSPPREEDEDAEGDEDDDIGQSFLSRGQRQSKSAFMSSAMSSPRGLKRSRSGKVQSRKESDLPGIARGLAKQAPPAKLRDSDDLVLTSEEIISGLEAKSKLRPQDELHGSLATGAAKLAKLWTQHARPSTREAELGPTSKDPLASASYVGSFLLQLHHPCSANSVQPPAQSRFQRSSAARQSAPTHATALPRALIDWLDIHHNPYPDDFNSILLHRPSPSNNDSFWDVIYASALRGRFDRVIRLLRDAGWENAITAEDDGGDGPGYEGQQLENTEAVIAQCTNILESCPGHKVQDWDVKNSDWALFRQRIRRAISDLEEFAEGDGEEAGRGNAFSLSEFRGSLSTASRRAESKVPWTIYENLKALYAQLLGSTDEIVLVSQDWLEASIYLTVWWDGEATGDFGRASLRKSVTGGQRSREVDVTPLAAYRTRLAEALALVTDEPEDPVFQVDTMDPTLVGIACAMEDNVDGVFALLRTWSIPVAAAVVEIAGLSDWLPQARPRSRDLVEQGFSSEDLMVLSHGPSLHTPHGGTRDSVLTQYADLLAARQSFQTADGSLVREGWELAVAVLGRLDDEVAAQRKIADLLERIQLHDEASVDKVLTMCSELGLADQARAISERYADRLAESSQAYGLAFVFYARAHAAAKLRDTLSLLTSLSLVQSAAIPPTAQTDEHLASLLSRDRTGLVRLAHADPKAASLLSSNLSGYATLRKFYDLRDQDVSPSSSSSGMPRLRPLERKREAAKALMAVIDSASDCIRGGLFDPDVESAIPTDALLALLGETLPLLSSDKRIFTKDQIFNLFRIVEDFATAPARIRDRANELFQASGTAYRAAADGSASSLLKKSPSRLSSVTASTESYDLLASSVLAFSQEKGKVADVHRGWDWRKGLEGLGGASAGPEQVLAVLRLALAQEVARGWGGRGDWL